jgi:hypothetical protein
MEEQDTEIKSTEGELSIWQSISEKESSLSTAENGT